METTEERNDIRQKHPQFLQHSRPKILKNLVLLVKKSTFRKIIFGGIEKTRSLDRLGKDTTSQTDSF